MGNVIWSHSARPIPIFPVLEAHVLVGVDPSFLLHHKLIDSARVLRDRQRLVVLLLWLLEELGFSRLINLFLLGLSVLERTLAEGLSRPTARLWNEFVTMHFLIQVVPVVILHLDGVSVEHLLSR